MFDPIEEAKKRLAKRQDQPAPLLLPVLWGGDNPRPAMLATGGAVAPPPTEPNSGVSVLGDKLLLGHSAYRRGNTFWVGSSDDAMTCSPRSHLITVAPSGSAKGTALAIPNLLNWRGSAVVTDPKGEMAWATARYRRDVLGQEVYILDPWSVVWRNFWAKWEARAPGRYACDETVRTAVCNPLAGLDPLLDLEFDRVTRDIAVGLCVEKPNDHNPFFARSGQGYLYRMIRSVCGGFAGYELNDRFMPMPVSLRSVRRLIEQGRDGVKRVIERCESRDPRLATQLGTYLSNVDSVQDTIRTAEVSTDFLEDRVLEMFLEPDPGERAFDLAALGDPNRHITVYLVLPTDMFSVMGGWLRVMLQRALREAMRNPREEKTLFLLDELGSIGRIDNLAEAYALGRGAGICCWGFWQDISQIRDDYGQRYATFEANSEVLQFHRCFDLETSKHMAERIGRHERLQVSSTSSYTSSQQGGSSSYTTSKQWQTEAAFDSAELEQFSQVLIGNFMKERAGGMYWGAPMDYFATPFFNGKFRPVPDKPFLGDAPWRPEMTVAQFAAWRERNLK